MGVWNFSIDVTTSEGNKLSCHRYHCSIQITEWQVGLHAFLLFLVCHWRLADSCNRHHGEHKIAEVPVGPSVIDRDFKNSSNDFRCSSCRTYPPTKFYSVPFANSVTCSSSHREVIWSSQGHLVSHKSFERSEVSPDPPGTYEITMIVFGMFVITSHDYFPLTMALSAQLKASSMASKKP
jgi:hypothetical protein